MTRPSKTIRFNPQRINNTMRGFTFIELIVVMVIVAILAVVLAMILNPAVRGSADLAERAELTAKAEAALQRMTREVRLALPNSVRIATSGGITVLEFLHAVDGGRYRARTGPGLTDKLNFALRTDTFDVLGGLDAGTPGEMTLSGGPLSTTTCNPGTSSCLVIYNTGQPATCADAVTATTSANAYLGSGNSAGAPCAGSTFDGNVAAISSIATTNMGFDNGDYAGWKFPFTSPRQRFYVVDTPVSYVCDPANGTITRHFNYAISATQSTTPGGTANTLADHVTACSFAYDPGTSTRIALVTIELTLTSDTGQSVTILQQAHVSNEP